MSAPTMTGPRLHLSPRQTQILTLIADGLTDREIAARLFVAQPTVKQHVADLMKRCGAATRAQAVAIAIRQGVIA